VQPTGVIAQCILILLEGGSEVVLGSNSSLVFFSRNLQVLLLVVIQIKKKGLT
jgi:hypothetical protein